MPPHRLTSFQNAWKAPLKSIWSTPRRRRPLESIEASVSVIELGETPGELELRVPGGAVCLVQNTFGLSNGPVAWAARASGAEAAGAVVPTAMPASSATTVTTRT